jgi:hypothetical protein
MNKNYNFRDIYLENYYSPFPRQKSNREALKYSQTKKLTDNKAIIDIPPSVTFSYMKKNPIYFETKKYSRRISKGKRPQTTKNKIILRNAPKSLSCTSNKGIHNRINKIIRSKRSSLTSSSKNYSCINIHRPKEKYLEEEEINKIFDDLGKDYPIKNKIIGLFPDRLLQSTKSIELGNKNINNNKRKINDMSYLKCAKIRNENKKNKRLKPEKLGRINEYKKNIFLNLIPQNPHNKSVIMKNNQNLFIKKDNRNYDNSFIKKQFENKNEKIMKQLEGINFYGPYYSYCPPCFNRNVDFYNNLDDNKLIRVIQQIKKTKEEGVLIGDKSKKMRKNNSFYY